MQSQVSRNTVAPSLQVPRHLKAPGHFQIQKAIAVTMNTFIQGLMMLVLVPTTCQGILNWTVMVSKISSAGLPATKS